MLFEWTDIYYDELNDPTEPNINFRERNDLSQSKNTYVLDWTFSYVPGSGNGGVIYYYSSNNAN